jgi:hypothetical protein
MHPAVLSKKQELFPFNDDREVIPVNRASAVKHFMSLPDDYPHCDICHRALVVMSDGYQCPKCHRIVISMTRISNTEKIINFIKNLFK